MLVEDRIIRWLVGLRYGFVLRKPARFHFSFVYNVSSKKFASVLDTPVTLRMYGRARLLSSDKKSFLLAALPPMTRKM